MLSVRAMLGGALLLGAALRLHGIRDQLIVSDEWHALHAAALTSLRALLRLVTFGATSIPMNLYCRLLLDGPGWSELTLRLPSLVAGMGSLLVFPILVRDLLKPRALVIFAYLIAISPLLTFYSRYARPYSLLVFFTFVSLIACYRWAVSGRMRYAVVFASSGAVAGYLHVSEARSIVLPLLLLFALKAFAPTGGRDPIRPSLAALVLAGLAPMVPLALLLLPGLLDPAQHLTSIAGRGRPDVTTLLGVSELLSGTADPVARGAFVALAALGFGLCFRRDRLLACLLLVVVAGSTAVILVTRPLESELPIIFARYAIALFPVVMMAVAGGIDGVLTWAEQQSPLAPRWTRIVLNLAAAGGLVTLFWLGPLPRLYAGRNDFTNHKAFQASYGPLSAANRYARAVEHLIDDAGEPVVDRIPPFYLRLAAENGCGAIIEYPLPVGDMNSAYFLYQARHRKRVMGGYFRMPAAGAGNVRPGVVLASWTVDEVLAEVRDPAKLRFRSLVNLGDPTAVHASGACYLIVHTDLEAELSGERGASRPVPVPPADYVRRFGQPVFADAWTTVFDLRHPPR